MKANELRIGSYYKLKSKTSIDENSFILKMDDIQSNDDITKLIEPIPLTEEWLLKLGFERGSDIRGECYFINEFEDNELILYLEGDDICYYDGCTMIIIESVHILQNLYSALKRDELTNLKDE